MLERTVVRMRQIEPATTALGALLLAAGVLLLYAGRHLTFFYDEWGFILHRRGGGLDTYLTPANGHLSLFPIVVYKLLFATVGLSHYTPYRLVGVAMNLLCGALLYLLVRRRLGPWRALVPTTLLLFMGTAFQDLLWPFQTGYFTSVAGGLAALALVERRDARGDTWASVLLVWSLTGSGVGLAFLVSCAVMLIAQGGPRQRAWVVAVPAGLFALWYIGWGSTEPVTSDALLAAPQYVAEAAAGATAGIVGLSAAWGPALAIAALALIVSAWQRRHGGSPTPLLLAAAAGAVTFWGLAAITRGTNPDPTASRYIYVGAVFILLCAAEAGVGSTRSAWLLAFGGVLVAGALIANLGALRAGERGLRASDTSVRASLAAVELAEPLVAPSFLPDPTNAPVVTAGPYLAAVRQLGSPALRPRRAPARSRGQPVESDTVLEQAEALAAAPTTAPANGTQFAVVEATAGGRVIARGLCETLEPTAPISSVALRTQPGTTVVIHAALGPPAAIYLRRFASAFGGKPFASVAGGASVAIRYPVDRARRLPWHLQIVAARPVDVCVS